MLKHERIAVSLCAFRLWVRVQVQTVRFASLR